MRQVRRQHLASRRHRAAEPIEAMLPESLTSRRVARPRHPRKQQENIMTSSKILAALALFSATASAPVFSATLHRQARHNYVSSRVNRAGVANHSWCLQNYSAAAEARCHVVKNGDRFVSGAGDI